MRNIFTMEVCAVLWGKTARLWGRFHTMLFFAAVFGILVFSVWLWYAVAYKPESRIEDVKNTLSEQSSQNQSDEKKFEEILSVLEDRTGKLTEEKNTKDLFYSE